jgi:hypothetical protein
MNSEEVKSKEAHLKKLVSCCRSILSGQISFALGCQQLNKFEIWLEGYKNIEWPDLQAYSSLTDHIPFGDSRLNCEIKYLIEKEIELQLINSDFKVSVLMFCSHTITAHANT